MYEPVTQNCQRGMSLMIRTTGNPASLVRAVYQQIWEVDPSQPVLNAATMKSIIANSMSVERFCTILLVVMGGIALLMAVVGLYSVMAFAVHERINEISIRMALGAGSGDILRLVTKHGFILTLVGLAIGLVGSFIMMRFLSGMLFQISATDPVTFIIVPLILIVVAMLACWLPARKAARVDPMKVLRYE
jgi:putative ABC transport system permease protein